METIIGLVAAGIGVSLVPERPPGASHPGVVFRPLAGPGTPIPYQVALAWRVGELSPVLRAFLAFVPGASQLWRLAFIGGHTRIRRRFRLSLADNGSALVLALLVGVSTVQRVKREAKGRG